MATYTLAQIAQHNTPTDLWMVIDNNILDVTSFLKEHPGGEQTLLDWAGKDGTVAFDEVGHSQDAWDMIDDYVVGTLEEGEKGEVSKKSQKKAEAAKGGNFFKPLLDNADMLVSFGVLASGLFMLYRLRKQKW